MGMIQEFKEFAVKGNALDMAVGIILGASFNKVVSSVVNDLLMPPIGLALGGVDFKDLKLVLQEAEKGPDGKEIAEVAVRYGQFLNTAIDFLIVAFTVFIIVKLMNRVIRKREGEAAKA